MLKCSQFAEYALGLKLWDRQKEIVDEYFDGTKTHGVWALGRRCVTGDTLIATDRGLLEIGSLKGQGELVPALNSGDPNGGQWRRCNIGLAQPDGSWASSHYFYEGGVQDVIQITTRYGYSEKGTGNHPVRVLNEYGDLVWRDLYHLQEGDYIALRVGDNAWPTQSPSIATVWQKHQQECDQSLYSKKRTLPSEITCDFAYALGVLVGDGSWTMRGGIEVTCHKNDLPYFQPLLEKGLGVDTKVGTDKRNENIRSISCSSKFLRNLLHDLGYSLDSKSHTKRVPWVIMQSPRHIVASFLSGFFDTDGCAEKQGKTITFSTASAGLARDIQCLLTRMGALCKLSIKIVNEREYWIGSLVGLSARSLFAKDIGFRLPRKQEIVLQGLNCLRDGGNSQAIPHQKEKLRRIIDSIPQEQSETRKQLRTIIGNAIKNGGEQFNARRLSALCAALSKAGIETHDAYSFHSLLEQGLIFDRVVKKVAMGKQEVFDLHVPDTNSFVGNGICNHNSGKTLLAAVAALYVCFVLEERYRRKVRKKEKWYIVTIANDQSQAKLALNNIRQLLIDSQFAKEITRETATEIEISNGCVFQAIPASARASRGKAVVMVIMDELAFSIEGDANRGAKAIYTALSPSIAQFGDNGRILELSSPWLTDGLFYEHYCEAQSGEYKFMQAINIPTWDINPNLPWGCAFLEAELKRDPEKFWVEYGAQFSKNLSSLLAPEVVEAAVDKKRGILLPQREFQSTYYLALDPAKGGVGRDNYTAAIVHYEGEMLIVDKFHSFDADFEINGKKEVNIKAVEQWIMEHHKAYGFKEIVLDQFNSASTIQSLSESLPIGELTWSVSTKMKAFSKMRQLFNAGLVSLYPHEVAIKQIKNLSVVYRQSGQWTVTGGKEANVDDYPFALAGAILAASEGDDIDWINSLVR